MALGKARSLVRFGRPPPLRRRIKWNPQTRLPQPPVDLVSREFGVDEHTHRKIMYVRLPADVAVTLTDWQRRHPVLASPALALRLYRQGAFR